jgi:hypothetical protein
VLCEPEQQDGEFPLLGSTRQSDLQPTGKPLGSKGPFRLDGPVHKVSHNGLLDVDESLTVRSKIDFTPGDPTANIVIDPSWEIIPVDEADVVVIIPIGGGEGPFGECSGWNAGTGVRIA